MKTYEYGLWIRMGPVDGPVYRVELDVTWIKPEDITPEIMFESFEKGGSFLTWSLQWFFHGRLANICEVSEEQLKPVKAKKKELNALIAQKRSRRQK